VQRWKWGKGVFALSADQIVADTQRMLRDANRLDSMLAEEAPRAAAVARFVREALEDFSKHIPLLCILCNRGMRDRHWQQAEAAARVPFAGDKSATLASLVALDLDEHIGELTTISEQASRE